MKKMTALILALMLALTAFSGCKGQEQTDASTTAPGETTPSSEPGSKDPSSDPSDATTKAPADETTEAPVKLDYSKYLNDYGFIEGISALELIPEIDFSKVEIKADDIKKDTEYAVENVIRNLTSKYSVEVKDRAVKDGDTLSIGYVGKTKEDGVAFEGGSTDETEVTIGVTSYIDGFLPQLIGHKPGETFDIEVTFPDPYPNNSALSGKEAIFTITIHYIKEAPEFTDEFLKAHWDDVKEFPDAKEGMTAEELKKAFYDYYYDYYTDSEVYSAVSDLKFDVEIPENALKYVENADECTYMEQYGVSFRVLLKNYYGYTDAQIEEIFQEEALKELIFQSYYEQAGWKVEESEYKEATGKEDNADSIEKLGRGYIARYVMLERALDEMRDKVTFVEGETSDK